MAGADDPHSLLVALIALRRDVADHVEAEADEMDQLPGVTPEVARHGQARLLDLIDLMVVGAGGHDPIICIRAAGEFERGLRRQHRLETTLRLHSIA